MDYDCIEKIGSLNISQETAVSSCSVLGERKLMIAVLERAVLDLSSDDIGVVKEAQEWFLSRPEDVCEPYSFEYICLMLELDRSLLERAIFKNNSFVLDFRVCGS